MSDNYIILSAFIALLVWEAKSPKRAEQYSTKRWVGNFALTFIPVVISVFISIEGRSDLVPSLMIHWQAYDLVITVIVCCVLLDGFMYALHRVSHAQKLLWRFHCLHHSDPSLDISTNFRHHPLEYVWVLLFLSLFLSIFNIPMQVFASYVLLSTIVQLWHHSNVNVPYKLERMLGAILVTPSMHQIHHSLDFKESNSNYGAVFSFWDKLFNTYISPFSGEDNNAINKFGVKGYSSSEQQNLYAMLIQPFQKR